MEYIEAAVGCSRHRYIWPRCRSSSAPSLHEDVNRKPTGKQPLLPSAAYLDVQFHPRVEFPLTALLDGQYPAGKRRVLVQAYHGMDNRDKNSRDQSFDLRRSRPRGPRRVSWETRALDRRYFLGLPRRSDEYGPQMSAWQDIFLSTYADCRARTRFPAYCRGRHACGVAHLYRIFSAPQVRVGPSGEFGG